MKTTQSENRRDAPPMSRAKLSRRDALKATAVVVGAASVATVSPSTVRAAGHRHRWGFLIDLNRCIGCKACAVACKTEANVPLGVFRSQVKELDLKKGSKVTRGFVPWLCNHCANPACLPDCPVDEIEKTFTWPDGTKETYMARATYQRPDGVVLVDQDRCVGCGNCVEACPYGVRYLNPAKKTVSEDAVGDHPADKCDLCVHRLDQGVVPACVNTCQGNARLVGDLNDPNSEIAKRLKQGGVAVLLPEKGTNPQCSYIGLDPRVYMDGRDPSDEV